MAKTARTPKPGAGFDFSLDRPTCGKKKVLSSLFLYADGKNGHRGYADRRSRRRRRTWDASKTLKLSCRFVRDKLVEVYFGQPKDY